MPASKPQDVRNIVLVGHGGAGKTSLAEAMLHLAGQTTRLGNPADGTSVLDYSDIEKERKHSVDPSLANLEHAGKTLNLIDTPGYPDFVGGAICGLSGADVAVVVISATSGIEVNTRKMFHLARQLGKAVAIVVNKIDGENVQFEDLLGHITETFGPTCKPMNLPAPGRKAVVDCFINDAGDSEFGDVHAAHTQIDESIIEADETLMEAYLGGQEVSVQRLGEAFAKAMEVGTVIPILFTNAKDLVGVREFMDAVANYFPNPYQVPPTHLSTGTGPQAQALDLTPDADKPFVGEAFKITTDPFVGKLAWVRILQGTMMPDTTYHLGDSKKTGKVGHLFKILGKDMRDVKKAVAGDIVGLAKVDEIHLATVLHTGDEALFAARPPMPTPMYSLAVNPKSRGDEQKISEALSKLTEEDPTFVWHRDSQTGETVISGVGDLHLRIILTKMKSRFDLEVETHPPKIPYRETITAKADGHHRHKKQTGGAGQFGEVYLRVEPLERGAGYEFADELFGESIPRQFLPAIEKGVMDVMTSGAIAGFPLQDIKVAITDGKHHPVDSKEVAFRTAGKWAFLDAIQKAKPAILEPFVNMEITIPASHMGDIASDLSGRRGRILGQDVLPGGMVTVKAQAPLSEVMQYNSQLRSVTAGQGSYTMELSHYEPVPGNVQQQIVANAKIKHEDKE